MRELLNNEVYYATGGHIHPSTWIPFGAASAFYGSLIFVALATGPNPISLYTALTVSTAMGLGFRGAQDSLQEMGW